MRLLADSDKIQLLTSLMEQTQHGIRYRPDSYSVQHNGQLEIELHALGSALQHADLLGPSFDSDVTSLESLFRAHARNIRKASQPRWEDGVQRYCFMLGSSSPADELGGMIGAALEAWEGETDNTCMHARMSTLEIT